MLTFCYWCVVEVKTGALGGWAPAGPTAARRRRGLADLRRRGLHRSLLNCGLAYATLAAYRDRPPGLRRGEDVHLLEQGFVVQQYTPDRCRREHERLLHVRPHGAHPDQRQPVV